MTKRLLPIIILLSLLIGAGTLRRGHQWGDDFAWYILQAKSIATGTMNELMEASTFINTESTTHVGPLAYPWGYPLILTPIYAIKGIHPLALKLPSLFFFGGFLVSLYLLIRTRLTETESLLIVSLFAFNPLLIDFLDQILSDIPYLFFSTLSLWLIVKDGTRSTLRNVLIGASIYFVVFTRTTGIVLLGCFLLVEFFRLTKNFKDWTMVRQIVLGAITVCITFVLLWAINALIFPGGGASYLSQYAGMTLETVRDFTIRYFNVYGLFFGESAGWQSLYYILVVFFLIGVWRRWKEDIPFLLFYGFWMIVHITYPYWQGPRYVFPLLPIFIYFIFVGMKYGLERLPAKYNPPGQLVMYGFWTLIIGVFLFVSGANAIHNLQNNRSINGPFDPYSKEVYNYIIEQTPADSVVVFFKPRVMKLMTNHNSIMSQNCDDILKGNYFVLSLKAGKNQQVPPEEIDACNLPLTRVLKNNRFIVYEIQK